MKSRNLSSAYESMHDKDSAISTAAFQLVLDLGRPELAPDILHAAAGEPWESDAVMGIVGLGKGVVKPLLERFCDASNHTKGTCSGGS